MPTVTVYKQDVVQDIKEFDWAFYVTDDIFETESKVKTLYWKTYHEEAWTTDNIEKSKEELLESMTPRCLWFVRNPPGSTVLYSLKSVSPDWTLTIGNVECPKGLYDKFDIVWLEISLIYADYRFIFSFTDEERGGNLPDMELPKPVVTS
jgi:hypothetical protein